MGIFGGYFGSKYRDPISGLPYADLAAFRELRKLYPGPTANPARALPSTATSPFHSHLPLPQLAPDRRRRAGGAALP